MRLTLSFTDRTLAAIRLLCGGAAHPDNTQIILAAIADFKRTAMQELEDLKAAVAAEETVIAAIVTYMQGIPALIVAAIAAHEGDADAMKASLSAIAASVTEDASKLTIALHDAPPEAADTTPPTAPADTPPVDATPPVDTTPPADVPPADTPPADTPPADAAPPADAPPADTPV